MSQSVRTPKKFKTPTAAQKKWAQKGYVHGFLELLRLEHGTPEGVTVGESLALREKLATKVFEQHWQNSINGAKRGISGRAHNAALRRRMGGSAPDQHFLEALPQLIHYPNAYFTLLYK